MITLILIALIVIVFYVKIIDPGFYWQKRDVFHVKPWLRFIKVFLTKRPFVLSVKKAYDDYPHLRYYGSYQFLRPSLFVRDVDLIKRITVKDFDHFTDHFTLGADDDGSLINQNLFSLRGERWRQMRTTLSPAFTSSKMRSMFKLIQDTADSFTDHFLNQNQNIVDLEMKDVFSKFTNDVIATCAFGIHCDSLKDPENEFFRMGKTVTTPSSFSAIRGLLFVLFPAIFKIFGIELLPKAIPNFFKKIVTETIEQRELHNIIRPDMIHLLMEARKGRLMDDKRDLDQKPEGFATVQESQVTSSKCKLELTDDLITAQALVFFLAGFDTSSTIMSFLAYELVKNPDIQKKLHEEIDGAGPIDYDRLFKMKYLDQVISETLRLYPPGFILNRVCVKDYKVSAERANEKDFVMEMGCLIAIPVFAIHRDEQYFPDPDRFDPERFSEGNRQKIVAGSYLPFGSGPRNCIGSRFALMECKVLIVALLSKFELVPVEKTKIPVEFAKTLNLGAKDGIWLGLKRRSKNQ